MTATATLDAPGTDAVPPYVGTVSGRFVSLIDPVPAQICLRDIAHQLALTPRWGGATVTPYSVAQHCVVVAEILPPETRLRALGLLHDAYEAYVGDLPRPLKRLLEGGDLPRPLKRLLEVDAMPRLLVRLDTAIHAAVGVLRPDTLEARRIAAADRAALWAEARDLCHPAILADLARSDPRHFPPADVVRMPTRLTPWPWSRAEEEFLRAARRYLPICPE